MTYRNDSDALLARNHVLEVELRRLRARLTPEPSPPIDPHDELDAARAELEFLVEDRAGRERVRVVVGCIGLAVVLGLATFVVGWLAPLSLVGALGFLIVATLTGFGFHPITGEDSVVHSERIDELRAYLAARQPRS